MKTITKITAMAFISISLFFSSCKKDKDNGPKETTLSKMYENGKLITEFIYSPQKKVILENDYDEVTGKLDYAIAFDYDASGNMITEKQYNEANKLSAIVNYTRDAAGKFIKHEYKSLSGADSGKITVRVKYSYDLAGRISKQSWVDLVTDKAYTTRELKYYSNGNLKSQAVYYFSPLSELQWKTDYSPAGDTLPQNMAAFKSWPVNFWLPDFTATEKYSYTYYGAPAPAAESKEIFSNRKYNSSGFITEQIITKKNILPAAPDEIKQMRYEYTDL
jgi:hypothetical protein